VQALNEDAETIGVGCERGEASCPFCAAVDRGRWFEAVQWRFGGAEIEQPIAIKLNRITVALICSFLHQREHFGRIRTLEKSRETKLEVCITQLGTVLNPNQRVGHSGSP
jgi:hypothetical protein